MGEASWGIPGGKVEGMSLAGDVLAALQAAWNADQSVDMFGEFRRPMGVGSDLMRLVGSRFPEPGDTVPPLVWDRVADGRRSSFLRAVSQTVRERIVDEDVRTLVLWRLARWVVSGDNPQTPVIEEAFGRFEREVVARCPEAQDVLPPGTRVAVARAVEPETMTVDLGPARNGNW